MWTRIRDRGVGSGVRGLYRSWHCISNHGLIVSLGPGLGLGLGLGTGLGLGISNDGLLTSLSPYPHYLLLATQRVPLTTYDLPTFLRQAHVASMQFTVAASTAVEARFISVSVRVSARLSVATAAAVVAAAVVAAAVVAAAVVAAAVVAAAVVAAAVVAAAETGSMTC